MKLKYATLIGVIGIITQIISLIFQVLLSFGVIDVSELNDYLLFYKIGNVLSLIAFILLLIFFITLYKKQNLKQ